MAQGPVLNPIAHLDKVGPRVKKMPRHQREAAERVAQFEAQRAQEEQMAGLPSGMVMKDLNPVEHQTKATFTPKPTRTVGPRPEGARVQHVRAPQEPADDSGNDLLRELEGEFSQATAPAEPAAPLSVEPDMDVETILKRYKGSPEEIAKQIAKSYANSEKRQRELEHEKQLLMKQGVQPVVQQQTPSQMVPTAMPQIKVQPEFEYKKWGDQLLDNPSERAKELEQHIVNRLEQRMVELANPLYGEAIDNRLFRKFPEVVTEDNLDVIKAMAYNEPGENAWEKTVSAVKKYKASMPSHTPQPNPDVQSMQQAVQTPTPQARTSGDKKMWKESDIQSTLQKKIRTGEYQRDPRWRNLIDTAYREGRVLRGQ